MQKNVVTRRISALSHHVEELVTRLFAVFYAYERHIESVWMRNLHMWHGHIEWHTIWTVRKSHYIYLLTNTSRKVFYAQSESSSVRTGSKRVFQLVSKWRWTGMRQATTISTNVNRSNYEPEGHTKRHPASSGISGSWHHLSCPSCPSLPSSPEAMPPHHSHANPYKIKESMMGGLRGPANMRYTRPRTRARWGWTETALITTWEDDNYMGR
jgi:hypothetical protein